MLFSATMPDSIMRLVNKHLRQPVHIEVAPAGTTADLVDQEIYLVSRDDKLTYLEKLLDEYNGTVLVFVRTKHGAANLTEKLKRDDYKAAEIHSNLSFNQRKNALAGFKSGLHRILVATDVAARGLDINDIELVVNYDLPDNSEDYVHRIGRTARAGKTGKAISFAVPSQKMEVKKIERLIKKELPFKKMARLATEPDRDYVEAPARQSYPSRSQSAPARRKMVTYGQSSAQSSSYSDSSNRTSSRGSYGKGAGRGRFSNGSRNPRYESSKSEGITVVKERKQHVSTQPDFSDLPDYLKPKKNFQNSEPKKFERFNSVRPGSFKPGSSRTGSNRIGSPRFGSEKFVFGKSGFEKKESGVSKPSFSGASSKKVSFGKASFTKRSSKSSSVKHYK